ncbi:MAG: thioredoxin domain-containing protein, partial [Micrococcales bacterium]|nr:thioredoxin domain-containing protein [Micrococcales bacterium]
TPEGGIMLGQNLVPGGEVPEDTIRVDLIFDYICPICGTLAEQATDSFLAAAQAGEISLVMHPLGYLDQYSSTEYSSRAANAVLTVASLAPEQFTDFDLKLWVNQPEEGGEGLSDEKIAELAKDAGVSDAVIAQFKDKLYSDFVMANTLNIASIEGFRGTPMVLMTYNDQTYTYDWSQNKLGEAIDMIFDGG